MRDGLFRLVSLCLMGLLLGNAGLGALVLGQVPPPTTPNNVPPPQIRELKGGEKHSYPFQLKANDYLNLAVAQRGIDVVLRFLGPDGNEVQRVDFVDGTQGVESLGVVVSLAGVFQLEIEAKDPAAKAGKYELRMDPVRAGTDQDRSRIEVEMLIGRANQLRKAGKSNDALPLATQALEKCEQVFGRENLLTAACLNTLASVYEGKSDYARAEPLYLRSLAILEKMQGPDSLDVGASLNNLALHYRAKGDYAKVEPLLLRSLAILEKKHGSDHPDVPRALNSLGLFNRTIGNYPQAEAIFQRALALTEKMTGLDPRTQSGLLHNLAQVQILQSNYPQAELLLQRALAIQEKAWGPEHPDVALSLNFLAALYRAKGDVGKVEPLLQRALAILEKALGPDHLSVALGLTNLGTVYRSKGDYAQAESLFRRALAIREKALGPNHSSVTSSRMNLAGIYAEKGDYAQAEALNRQALAIREARKDGDPVGVATALNNLAMVLYLEGKYAEAEPLFQRSLAIREKALGTTHPETALSLNNLAKLYQAQGNPTQALSYQARCNEVTEQDLQRNLVSGSERQKALYLKQTAFYWDQTLSLQVPMTATNPAARKVGLTIVLQRKGRALDVMTSEIGILRKQSNPHIQKLLDSYAKLVEQISALTLQGPEAGKSEGYLAYLRTLEEQKEKLENDISRQSLEFKVQLTPVSLEAVQQQIPTGAALVEYAVYRPFDVKARTYGTPRYVAYVLKPGSAATADPLWSVDLGPAEPIEQAVVKLRKALSTPQSSLTKDVKPASQALEKLIFAPLRPNLGKAGQVLISPDGQLSLIPFAALVDEKGAYLTESYRLTYLTSGRDLLRLAVKVESHQPPLVLADPDFAQGKGPVLAGHQYVPLKRLKGTESEGVALKSLFPQTNLKMQETATAEAIKAVQKPEILHIATHGYFLEDAPQPSTQGDERSLLRTDEPLNAEPLQVENPLLRSWLFFAGANQGGTEGGKGTMTALEVAQLDLWGTKLVTLSACETGVGETKNGDGVYGLRRALVLAGSESQMMSLWSVSDQGTRELMVDYYRRLKAGEGRSDALRNAQLNLLKSAKRQHPYYWAAFIQSGEWANLAGQR
ncbi:MAG: CHAT domain-containing protein [Blastocatellia bacterium]|nr:CHAT domain-containing protein [Blastocatellia bacterium]